jgi:hypothetical protein
MHEMTPLQAWSKCCISAYVCRRPHKIHIFGAGANRSKQRQNRGTGTPAATRPQRASALAFFAKKSDCRERGAGRTFERCPSRLGSASAAASCYAQLCVRMLQPRATCKRCER